MRYLTFILLIACSIAAYSSPPIRVISHTTISTDNWYPLSEQEMKAAAVDAALTEFTNNGQFKIMPHNKDGNPQADGELRFRIALVGPAEVVKLTTQLHLNDAPSYVASVSMNIHGMDYHGIYNAFEYVGAEAAKRLNAKMTLPTPASNSTKNSATTQADTNSANSATTTLFNQAQTLKRKGQYHQARAMFEEIAEQQPENQWTSLAKDELRYGLPMFEADNIMPDNAMGDPAMVLEKMQTVSHLYRQILADNTDNPKRVIDVNQRLDQMSISLKHMKNAIKASALSRACPYG